MGARAAAGFGLQQPLMTDREEATDRDAVVDQPIPVCALKRSLDSATPVTRMRDLDVLQAPRGSILRQRLIARADFDVCMCERCSRQICALANCLGEAQPTNSRQNHCGTSEL